jgi:hypothetical protein
MSNDNVRPSEKDLRLVGFNRHQMNVLAQLPDDVVQEAYYTQLELLMSGNDITLDF